LWIAVDDEERTVPGPVEEREHPSVRRWPAALALLAVAVAYALAPSYLRIGPRWLPFALAVVVLIPLNIVRRLGHYLLTRMLALVLTGLLTASVFGTTAFFVFRLPGGKVPPLNLLRDGALIWGANVLVFALWYWELDCDGPHTRHVRGYRARDLLFPQLAMGDDAPAGWKPEFLDYLFHAFNTSTAFSPTDTLVLSHRMKVLMMIQSFISVIIVGVVIARAINTLS
jgi:hypothetical protein